MRCYLRACVLACRDKVEGVMKAIAVAAVALMASSVIFADDTPPSYRGITVKVGAVDEPGLGVICRSMFSARK